MSEYNELFLRDTRLFYHIPTYGELGLQGMLFAGYASEPNNSIFVQGPPYLALGYKLSGQTYLLFASPVGTTSEPNGSLWRSSGDDTLRFAYGGQAYQVNRHRVRNNLTNNTPQSIQLSGVYISNGSWFYFNNVGIGLTSNESIGYISGLVNSIITAVRINGQTVAVPNFQPPCNGGVIVISGTVNQNAEGDLIFTSMAASWTSI
jgi:hypothetical protein